MPSKALSPYNRHVRSFAKTYKGKDLMKAAARAWNKKTGKPKASTSTSRASRSRSASKVSRVGKNGKLLGTLGAKGAIEDFAWGFGGLMLMGANNPVALPAIRLVQGVQGKLLNRVGKGRLTYALIDLADLVIAGQASVQSIFDSIRQLTKIVPA